MKCPACGHENLEDAAFCGGCGTSLPSGECSSCGRPARPGERFCQGCGASLVLAADGRLAADAPGVERPPDTGAPLPSSFAGGRYQVRAFLGEGAKKRVYLAHDTKLDRDVAFALIKTDGLDADGLVRVRREAQAMGRLGSQPQIVTIFDTGDEGGCRTSSRSTWRADQSSICWRMPSSIGWHPSTRCASPSKWRWRWHMPTDATSSTVT
jgi:hypothetical protein